MNLTTPDKLPPIEGLEFFDAIHRYSWKGALLPYSVSQMAKDLTPEVQKAFERTREDWEPRGNFIHAAAMEWKLTGQIKDMGEYAEWLEPLMEHPHIKALKPIATEYQLCDPRYGIGGTFDLLAKTPIGKTVLVDYKSLSTYGRDYDIRAQLGGYLSLLHQHWPMVDVDACWGVWIKPGKTYTTAYEPLDCLGEWEARRHLVLSRRDAPA